MIDLGAMVFGLPRAVFPALATNLYGGGAATVGYLTPRPASARWPGHCSPGGSAGYTGRAARWRSAWVLWGLTITAFGLVPWLPAALALLAAAGAADVVSAVFRMMIVQQVTPDGMQGRVTASSTPGSRAAPGWVMPRPARPQPWAGRSSRPGPEGCSVC